MIAANRAGRSRKTDRPATANATPFATLTPDAVLDAAEALGLGPDGHLFALNSYENRVYRVGRADHDPVVIKFYRAGRWSDHQILEEHEFARELAAAELPVAAPLPLQSGTLHHHDGFRLAVFPLCPGTAPEVDQPGARELLGRTLARMHAIGARQRFDQRLSLAGAAPAARARAVLLRSALLPAHMQEACARASAALVQGIEAAFAAAAPVAMIRLHGDCHLGNILWRSSGPLFVDLDDCMNGPRMQDLWMFLSGSAPEQQRQWAELAEGYRQFGTLEFRELYLIEALRATRMLHHAAWVAERWSDPAFPRAFPWAAEARFWEGYVGDLQEQCSLLQEPPLQAMLASTGPGT
jgi:Ser/Thr protein kinase RdoA (MazF antagonist)